MEEIKNEENHIIVIRIVKPRTKNNNTILLGTIHSNKDRDVKFFEGQLEGVDHSDESKLLASLECCTEVIKNNSRN